MNIPAQRKTPIRFAIALALASLLLAGCADRGTGTDTEGTASTPLGSIVQHATDRAREKLATENISLSYNKGSRQPKAEITPRGDLLIAGERIDIDDAQRALLLEHRAHIVAVAEAGIAIGVQGADLGMKAAGTAIRGVLSGNTGEIEQRIEAEARKIEAEAMKLCDLLPPLMASQHALADAIPALGPYATMDQSDIDDCRKGNWNHDKPVAV